MARYENLIMDQFSAVNLVTPNSPPALNAFNSAVLEELITAFAAFEADPSQGCAVVTGAG